MRGRFVWVLMASALFLVQGSPALAWSNGARGPNAFGTHDWILRKALDATGGESAWVRRGTAMRATDDPDMKSGIDHASGTWWHVYDRWGDEYGGADEAAAVWFKRTQRRLDNGKLRSASRALGYLAHIVSDVAQPMHTDQTKREERIHSSFESAVDGRIRNYPFRYDGKDEPEAGPLTRSLGRAAHRRYKDLVGAYTRNGYNDRVNHITTRQLMRAANALADLISSLR